MAIKVSIGKMSIDLGRFEQQVTRAGFAWLPAVSGRRGILLTADGRLGRYGATVRVFP